MCFIFITAFYEVTLHKTFFNKNKILQIFYPPSLDQPYPEKNFKPAQCISEYNTL